MKELKPLQKSCSAHHKLTPKSVPRSCCPLGLWPYLCDSVKHGNTPLASLGKPGGSQVPLASRESDAKGPHFFFSSLGGKAGYTCDRVSPSLCHHCACRDFHASIADAKQRRGEADYALWVHSPLWCHSGVPSNSCCQPLSCSSFCPGVEHKLTKDRSATKPSQLSPGACVVCGQSEGRAARPRVVGRGGGGGKREWDQEQECCCHCPPPELSSKGQTVQLQPLCQTQSYFRGTKAQSRQRSRNGSTMI